MKYVVQGNAHYVCLYLFKSGNVTYVLPILYQHVRLYTAYNKL